MQPSSEPLWAVVFPGRPLAESIPGLPLYEAQMVASRLGGRLARGPRPVVRPMKWQRAKHASREAEPLPADREVCEEYALFVRRVRRPGVDVLFYSTRRAAEKAAAWLSLPPGFTEVHRVYWWLAR